MKIKWQSFVPIGLTLLLILSLVGCSASRDSNEEITTDSVVDELWDSLREYTREIGQAQRIANENANKTAEAFRTGKVDGLEFRKRIYLITLIQANTISYIDSKYQYDTLHALMWMSNDGEPPTLYVRIPELERDSEKAEAEYEQYLNSYIDCHWQAIDDFAETLYEYEN